MWCVHRHNAPLQHLGPTSKAVTPLCWWCQPDQRAAAWWGHRHPRRAGPLGPPQGVMSGPDLSGTWGDKTQETRTPINSSLPSKPRHWTTLGSTSPGHSNNSNHTTLMRLIFLKIFTSVEKYFASYSTLGDCNSSRKNRYHSVWSFCVQLGVVPWNV